MTGGIARSTLLAGVNVVELGTMITAPLAGMMLADIGADVLKVEHPEGGDPFRNFRGGLYSPNFIAYNRNKRSMKLNLRDEAGRAILGKLIERADVLIENYRHGVLEQLGFSAEKVRALNPRLIHCSITGFGAGGPYSARPAYDTVGVALSGIASLMIDPANPQLVGPTIADNVSGMYACYGILGALYERQKTGKGRRVEVNMLDASIAMIPDPVANFTQLGICNDPLTRVAQSQSFAFNCADGKMLVIHLSIPEKFWRSMLVAIERPALAQDPRFADRPGRIKNFLALQAAIAEVIATQPRSHWTARLEANDVPFAPVQSIPEVLDDPQVAYLGTFCESVHPTEGRVVSIRRPVHIDGEREGVTPPPVLGEHTDEVLAGIGYGKEEIERLHKSGVV